MAEEVKRYRVVAPYIQLTTSGPMGRALVGFHQGAIVPEDVPQRELSHHLDSGLIAEVGPDEGPAAAGYISEGLTAAGAGATEKAAVERDAREAAESGTGAPGNEVLAGLLPAGTVAPAGAGSPPDENANRAAWERYARRVLVRERGVAEQDAADRVSGRPKEDLIAEFGPARGPVATDPAASAATPEVRTDPAPGAAGDPPQRTAPKQAWMDYAVAVATREHGRTEDEARAEVEGKTKEELVSRYDRPRSGEAG